MIDPERLKPFLTHDDAQIRRAAAEYFAEGRSRDPEILPRILRGIAGRRVRSAREMTRLASRLVVDAAGLDALTDALGRESDEGVAENLANAALTAPIELLRDRGDALIAAKFFPKASAPRLQRRRMYDGWAADRLWDELRRFSKRSSNHAGSEIDMTVGDDLVAALARLGTPDDAALVAMLDDPEVAGQWIEIFVVRLIGARGIAAALPRLTAYFHSEDDYFPEEIPDALARIGDPSAIPLALSAYRETPEDDLPFGPLNILQEFHHPDAEAAILDLLREEEDLTRRTLLVYGLCKQFSEHAVAAVETELALGYDRQFTILEHDAVAVLDVLGLDHPRLAEWRASREAESARLTALLDEWESEDTAATTSSRRERAEPAQAADAGVTLPIVRDDTRVGRNDPCPCGSGKKFKKCCAGSHNK